MPYVHDYFYEPLTKFLVEGFDCLVLLLVLADKQYMHGYAERVFSILKYFTSKHQVMHTERADPGASGSGGGDGGKGWRPTKDNPQSKLAKGPGVNFKNAPLTLVDANNNNVPIPAQYTGSGPADRAVGQSMANLLQARLNLHHSSNVSRTGFTAAQWGWLSSHLQAEHNRPLAEATAQNRPEPNTLWKKMQMSSLSNNQQLRDSLRNIH